VSLNSEFVKELLVEALGNEAIEIRIAAGEMLVQSEAREVYSRVVQAMLQIANAKLPQDFRRRAGRVLRDIPGGGVTFYQPVQAALGAREWRHALQLIEAAMQILPQDVDLFWWRGHALRGLGERKLAAESFERARELEWRVSAIPQALAETLLDLGEYARAIEAARNGVEIAPDDAEAQSILAFSTYKGGAIDESVEAASKAVALDPVHSEAIWILVLGRLRQANLDESRAAIQHALRVRELLSPGLDTSFEATVLKELASIKIDNSDILKLVAKVKDAIVPKGIN
jgi:tetratricopeptide (TPR) repeat protein